MTSEEIKHQFPASFTVKQEAASKGANQTVCGKNYFTGVGTDITERKETEEALRKSEGILRSLVQTIPDLVWLKDTDGVYMACNTMFERFFGAREKDIVGKTDYDFVDRELAELFRANDCKAMMAGKPTSNEEWITFADDGRQALLETIKTPMYDDSGELIGVLGIGRDITERKRAEDALKINREALHRQNELFVSLLKNLTIGVFMVEVPSGKPLVANDTAVDLLGRGILSHASLSNLSEVYHACKRGSRDPYPVEEMPIVRGMRGEKSHVDDMVVRRPDGTKVLLEVFGSPVTDSQGTIWASLVSFFDISERTQAEMEKFRLQAQLQQAQKLESIGQLAGGVAHDFNNMLSVILGHAEIALMKQETTQELHKHLQEIRKAAIRSAGLTRQLLAFARKQTISPTVLDINETVEGMLKMLRRLIGEDIHLIWRPEAHPWPVKVDPSQIDQILANLCVNARDAIRGVGTVTIETGNRTFSGDDCAHLTDTKPGDYVILAVSDTGCGMEQELLGSIFEPFFTTKEMGQGTGLGLATVCGIVKQNNGFINVLSEPGQGTTFTIYLPRCESGKSANETAVSETVCRGHETILLVEDQPEILAVCSLFLRDMGYTVLIADGPLEAIRLADNYPGDIHLLLTDVIMPEMNGRDLANRLTAVYPDMKRLFMSGYTDNVIARHGVLEEGENFIQKPFSMKDLAVKLRTVLGV